MSRDGILNDDGLPRGDVRRGDDVPAHSAVEHDVQGRGQRGEARVAGGDGEGAGGGQGGGAQRERGVVGWNTEEI